MQAVLEAPATEEVQTLGKPLAADFDSNMTKAAESAIQNCSEIRLRISWFGTSTKVDDETIVEMLEGTGAERQAVSFSKRLLASKHEAVKAANAARQAIKDYVSSMTIPMLALASGQDNARKDAGIRLIQKKDMIEFDERLRYLQGILGTTIQGLQAALPEIKSADQVRLGKLYKETDYPADVTKLVNVEWSYKNCNVDIEWESICPTIFERERAAAKQKFEAVVENAAVEFADRLVGYVKQVMGQLGNRIRLNPKKTSKYVELAEAEVLEVKRHDDDPEHIPIGSVWLKLRREKSGTNKKDTVWMDEPVPEKLYMEELQPYEGAERHKLYPSTIDNLKSELESFASIGELLGPYKDVVAGGVTKVRDMLAKGSRDMNSEKIADQLRKGEYFRTQMKETLASVVDMVEGQMTEVQHVRRRINRNLIGKV